MNTYPITTAAFKSAVDSDKKFTIIGDAMKKLEDERFDFLEALKRVIEILDSGETLTADSPIYGSEINAWRSKVQK